MRDTLRREKHSGQLYLWVRITPVGLSSFHKNMHKVKAEPSRMSSFLSACMTFLLTNMQLWSLLRVHLFFLFVLLCLWHAKAKVGEWEGVEMGRLSWHATSTNPWGNSIWVWQNSKDYTRQSIFCLVSLLSLFLSFLFETFTVVLVKYNKPPVDNLSSTR